MYSAKSSAVRAAKKLHGDNWADLCKIVPAVGGGFEIQNNPTTAIESDIQTVAEKLKANLAALTPATPKAKPDNTKSVGGRPISPVQVKTRRSLVTYLNSLNGAQFTVKQARAKIKQKMQHISNAVRWAESTGLVERIDYLENKGRPGRRELIFKPVVAQVQKAA